MGPNYTRKKLVTFSKILLCILLVLLITQLLCWVVEMVAKFHVLNGALVVGLDFGRLEEYCKRC